MDEIFLVVNTYTLIGSVLHKLSFYNFIKFHYKAFLSEMFVKTKSCCLCMKLSDHNHNGLNLLVTIEINFP